MAMIQQALEGGNVQIIVYDGQRAGWMETQEDTQRIFLAHIYIKSELQGKGIGTYALTVLIRRSEVAGKSLTLSVMKNNPARKFYEKCGFEVVGEERFKYHMVYMPENPSREPGP
jgi:ribosomal protein S18 acetylase RimI-like enzyme